MLLPLRQGLNSADGEPTLEKIQLLSATSHFLRMIWEDELLISLLEEKTAHLSQRFQTFEQKPQQPVHLFPSLFSSITRLVQCLTAPSWPDEDG